MAQVIEMPYITFRTIGELLTPELKAKFIARISEAVADVIVEESARQRLRHRGHRVHSNKPRWDNLQRGRLNKPEEGLPP